MPELGCWLRGELEAELRATESKLAAMAKLQQHDADKAAAEIAQLKAELSALRSAEADLPDLHSVSDQEGSLSPSFSSEELSSELPKTLR